MVEREHLGGICLNWGCIPTKALLRTSDIYHLFQRAEEFGLKADNVRYDIEAIVKRSRKVAGRLSGGVGGLLKKNKVTVIDGEAKLEKGAKAPKVVVKGKDGKSSTYEAKHVIVATGARARTIPAAGLEPDGKTIWT